MPATNGVNGFVNTCVHNSIYFSGANIQNYSAYIHAYCLTRQRDVLSYRHQVQPCGVEFEELFS